MKSTINKRCNVQKIKKSNEKPNKLPDDFAPPDGGWGWMVIVACGISNLCLLPLLQNFGLIFRERFSELGISLSEITSVTSMNMATTSIVGLANGPLFRTFSFRQVAFVGSTICFFATIALSRTTTFAGILICMSICHAAGMGITLSANALALNTYFKKKRRIAVGLSWTCTGFGPIIMPHIITALMPIFGVSGTVLILGGLTLHSVAGALVLQPVSWHAKKRGVMDEIRDEAKNEKGEVILTTKISKDKENSSIENIFSSKLDKFSNLNSSRQGFGSQYLFYDDKEEGAMGIDVISAESPMISRANDGWFSSASNKALKRENPQVNSHRVSNCSIASQASEIENRSRKMSFQGLLNTSLVIVKESNENIESSNENCDSNETEKLRSNRDINEDIQVVEEQRPSMIMRCATAIAIFFDLGLLKDFIFLNLMIGMTLATFVEINFAVLTPFILLEYGLTSKQVATVMSILGAVDVIVRLSISFIASNIGFNNRTFFLIGIGCMAAGRIIIAHVSSYEMMIMVAVLIGFGKGLRTIFMALVIPAHVPLSRLPAASGLLLVASGIVYSLLGPVVGWIRDVCGNYTPLLHSLNILTYLTIISWILEAWITSRKNKTKDSIENNNNNNNILHNEKV